MPVTTMRDAHVDRVLTNFALGSFLDNREFIYNRFFPTKVVEHQSDRYRYWPSNYILNVNADTRRSELGVANMIGATSTYKSYSIQTAALRTAITEEEEANADDRDILWQQGTNLVMGVMNTKNEKEFLEEFCSPNAPWTFKLTGVDSNPEPMKSLLKWSDAASDPVKDLQILMDNMGPYTYGNPFNKMIISNDVFIALLNHPSIRDRISTNGTPDNPTKANLRTLAQLFNINEVFVARNIYNSATENVSWIENGPSSTDNHYMLRRTVLLAYAPDSLGSYTAGIRFVWGRSPYTQAAAQAAMRQGAPVVRRYVESPAIRASFIEAEQAFSNVLCSPDLGVLLTDIIEKDPNSLE